MTEEQKFSKQHSVSLLEDHSILLYDNSWKNEASRALIIKINEKNKTIEDYKEYDLNVFSTAAGSIQAIDEKEKVFLLSHGQGNYYGKSNIEEKNLETGETYFTLDFLDVKKLYNVLKIK